MDPVAATNTSGMAYMIQLLSSSGSPLLSSGLSYRPYSVPVLLLQLPLPHDLAMRLVRPVGQPQLPLKPEHGLPEIGHNPYA